LSVSRKRSSSVLASAMVVLRMLILGKSPLIL